MSSSTKAAFTGGLVGALLGAMMLVAFVALTTSPL